MPLSMPLSMSLSMSLGLILALTSVNSPLAASELHTAVRMEDGAAFTKALEGAPLDALDSTGRTALFYAVITRKPMVVQRLLDAGAKVSVPGQVREPLWAALVNGDIEIILMLLKHGADPATGDSPLRPIDAAILSGRVEVLRKLIEAKPKMTLPNEFSDHSSSTIIEGVRTTGKKSFVDDAMLQKHYGMAGFLIQQGALKGIKQNLLNDLLLRAMSIEPIQPELIDSLLEAGADPIEEADTRWKFSNDYLAPQSGLEIAARMGRADMVKRMATRKIGQIPANRLLTLALNSGDEATIAAVRSFVPHAQPYHPARRPGDSTYLLGPEEAPRNSWDTRAAAELLLKPRVAAPPSANTPPTTGTRVAVIADAHSASEAFLLAAKLSMVEGIVVLDRDEVAAVLRERDFVFESKTGITEVADRLSAKELILIGKPGTKDDGVLRTEVVDVRTGLITHRLHTEVANLNPDPWVASITSAIRHSKERLKSPDGLHAVTLLGVGTIRGAGGADAVRSLVSAALMAEVDATPDCVALTRLQMKPLIEEQVLGGEGSIWKAGWAIEAGASALAGKKIELRFRLRDLSTNEAFDTVVQGDIQQIGGLVGQAWAELITKSRIGKTDKRVAIVENGEAKALLEEAQWRFKLREYEAAAQLADTLCVMNGSDSEAQFLRILARVKSLLPPHDSVRYQNSSLVRGTVLYDLDGWLEVLALMQQNFDQLFETDARRHQSIQGARPGNGCFEWLHTMVRTRAATPAWAVRPEEKDALAEFDRELENWCRRFFTQCIEDKAKGDLILLSFDLVRLLEALSLHQMPWLDDAALELLGKRYSINEGNDQSQAYQARFLYDAINSLSKRAVNHTQASETLTNQLNDPDDSRIESFRQDSEFIMASDSSRMQLADTIVARLLKDLRSGKAVTSNLLPFSRLARYRVIERTEFDELPLTPQDLLFPVPAGGLPDAELLRNLGLHAALRAANHKLVAERLLRAAMIANQNEVAPGTARLRGRVSSAIRSYGLDDPRLNAFLESLPPDISSDEDTVADTRLGGIGHVALVEMPAGAKFFMVTQVLPDPHRGVIWWSGGFLPSSVNCVLSNEEIIPGLVRVNPVTGETVYAVTSNQWLNARKEESKWINPNAMSVLANEVAVVWHVARHGVYHVDASTMKLENMLEDTDALPQFIGGGLSAAAMVGDAVFVSEHRMSGYNEIRGLYEISLQRVLRLRRGEAPVVVVETGRRPKVSELDTDDTELTMVTSHRGKFRIIANSQPAFFARGIKMVDFDSTGSPVKDSLVTDQRVIESAFINAGREKAAVLAYRKSWPLKNGGRLSSGNKSGMLELERNGKRTPVPVKLPLPEGLDVKFRADKFDENGQKTNERSDFSIHDFASTHCVPVIVYQDGDTLGIMIHWRGSMRGLFPIIWKVRESDLFPKIEE